MTLKAGQLFCLSFLTHFASDLKMVNSLSNISLMLFRRFCRMFSLKLSTLIFSYCVIASKFFSEELVHAFSTVFFVGVKRPIVKPRMLFALIVSEPFKSV